VENVHRADVERWLQAYVEAWKTYEPARIAALFSEDVSYRYHPYDEPLRGRAAVVDSWLGKGEEPDPEASDAPGTYDAAYRPVAIDGDTVVAVGSTSYRPDPDAAASKVFDNCFVMRFDADGRCREFTEWYVRRPRPGAAT
jgi:hypothetical protein